MADGPEAAGRRRYDARRTALNPSLVPVFIEPPERPEPDLLAELTATDPKEAPCPR